MTQLPPDYLSTSSPYNYDQPLPPVARTNAVTQVPPAKKITFYKSGDPQFGGVKMAINQRSFKSFNALMDDLSHRVPLPFGVRTITTPRGIHCISTLDQLEDGGCYLCSDKKYVTPISLGAAGQRAGPPRNSQPASDLKRAAQEVKREDHSTTFTQSRLRIPKKITLVKNGDISIRRPIILNRRNARSFKTLLDEISEIMQFTVKKLYTVDGKKIDSMQALLHCPNVLMCVGQELFRPVAMENSRKPSAEKLPGLTSRSNSHVTGKNSEMNFGLKAKKSVIHPRSSMSNRSMRLSLSSEKSYPNGLTTSSENGASCSNNCSHSKAGDLVRSLVNDDIEKRVHVNKDGSLSVEMKVRFRLLNDETLQWSTQIKKSNLMNMLPCEESGIDEDNGVDLTEKSNPEASSEVEDSLYPCDADSYISKLDESENEEARCHNCGKPCKDYDIWKNPMHMPQKEEPGVTNTWYAHSSCSSTSSHRRIVRKKMTSVDSTRTSSSGEYSEHVVRESSCYSETVETRVGYHTVGKCCCPCNCTKTNTSQRGSLEEPELVACSVHSPNEEGAPGEATMVQEGDENQGSRARSRKSRSSRCSAKSEVKVCEETSNATRSFSACSVKKEVEDIVDCTSSLNSKRSMPLAKDTQDDISENDQVILSFSNESCPMKENGEEEEVEEEEVEKEEEETNEIYSVSDNVASSQSVKDEASECGRCSTQRSVHCETCNGSNRSDSDEVHKCSAASSSSRVSKRSKRSQNHLETGSRVSAGSSMTSTTREKKTKSSLHAEDVRSNSKASFYSRSSQEVETRAIEGQPSHDSRTPRSNVSSLSETAASPAHNDEGTGSTSKCFSKSSKGSQKGSQQEATSKASSPCSSFSGSNEKNGNAQGRSQTPSASMTESTCSNCGHMRKTRNDDLQSAHSKISSHSEVKSKCAETEASGRSGDAGSQSSMALSSKPRRKKKNSLHADVEHSSCASASRSASVYSLHCPTPPKGRPGNRKGRTVVLKKNSNTASACAESESMADKERKEEADLQAPEMDIAKGEGEEEEGSCFQKSHGEPSGEGDALEGCEEVIPSSLPNTTPEEVVYEWLRKIPSETLPMKDEMQDDGEGSVLDPEQPSCSESQEPLEEELSEMKEDTEECKSTAENEADVEGAEEETLDEEGNKDADDEKASKAMSEGAEEGTAACNQSVISNQNNHKKDLPSTIQTSVQIMKALLASKQEAKLDRSHSLPEVSPTMGRKLSNSANILITCLASLQLLDEELGPSTKADCLNRPRYTELLNIFQALWFEGASEKSGPSSGQHGEVTEKAAAGFKGHNSKEVTPMSSSGVDVSSGDGGSGEGSIAGTQECALPPEKTDEAKHSEEEANVGEKEEDQEEDSQLPTPCSKSEGEEQAESAAEETAEAQETLDSDCKIGQEEEKEMTEEQEVEETDGKKEDGNAECEENHAEAEIAQDEAQEETVVEEAEDSPNQEDAEAGPAEPSNNDADAPSASETNDAGEPEPDADKPLAEANLEAPNTGPPQATMKPSPTITQQRSIDPDPVWVLKLLKKIEKEFLTHYVSAMSDFKVKWNLPNSEELDLMIAELKEDVSRRIEKSIEVELRKIRSRAGRRTPRPPENGLQHESTVQAQHRRRRLQSLHKMSLFNERNRTQSRRPETRDSSHESDDAGFLFRATLRDSVPDELNEQLSKEEYCPCDACIKKKMAARATVSTVVVSANAPVVKAFDLQQILRMKKGNGERKAEDGGAEGAVDEEAASSKQAEVMCEPEENQETEPSVQGQPDEANEKPEVKAAEVPAEGEEAANEEVEEETKEEGEEEGNKEEEEIVTEEDENVENEEKEEEEAVKENEEEEAKEEEETVKEDGDNEEKEAEEEEVEEAEGKEEEETVKEEEDNEEEAEEEVEETVKEEAEEAEEEAKEEEEEVKEEEKVEEAATNEEEGAVKEEDDNEEEEAKEEEETKEEEVAEEEAKEEEEEAEKDAEAEEEEVEEEAEAEEEAKEKEEEAEEDAEAKEEEAEEDAEAEEEAKEEAEEEVKEEEEEEAKEEEEAEEEAKEEEEEEAKEEEEAEEEAKEEEEAEEDAEAEEEEAEEEAEAEEDAKEEEEAEEEAKEEAEEEVKEEEEEEAKEEEEAEEEAKEEAEEEVKEEEEEEAKEEEEAEEEAKEEAEEEVEAKEEEEEAKEEEEAEEKEEEEAEEAAEANEDEEAEEEAEEEAKKEEVEEEEAKEEEAEEEAKEEEVEEAEEKEEEGTIKEEENNEEEAIEEVEVVDVFGEEETIKEEEDAEEEEEAKEEEVEEPGAKEEEDTVKEEEEEGKEEEEEAKEEEEAEEEEEAKEEEEAEKETEEEEEAKETDEEATHSEEAEEDSKMEEETEGVEAEGGANEAGEKAEEDAGPEAECGACLEAADVEDKGDIEETGEAEGNGEEAEGEDNDGPVQDNQEEGGKEAEADGTIEDALSPRNGSALSRGSSMGNCSLQSQKGSEDGSDREDCKEEENVDNDNGDGIGEAVTHTEAKSPKMYPDSDEEEEEEEEDGAASQTSAVKGGEPQTDENEGGQAPQKKGENSEAIDQDDLDF